MKVKIRKVSEHKFKPNKYAMRDVVSLSRLTGDWVQIKYYDLFIDSDMYTHFFFYKELK